MTDTLWTVARFPDGSWTYGGPPGSPDYELCTVYQIKASTSAIAIRRAQGRYRRAQMKVGNTKERDDV